MKKVVSVLILSISVLLLLAGCKRETIDLTQYIGQQLSDVESELGVSFKSMEEYPNFENTFRAEQNGSRQFDCILNVTTARLIGRYVRAAAFILQNRRRNKCLRNIPTF